VTLVFPAPFVYRRDIMDWLDIHQGLELVNLNTEQLDKLPLIDLHSILLQEDPENIPSIIRNLSAEKLQVLIDLVSWKNDRFDVKTFSEWMQASASGQLKSLDHSEMALMFYTAFQIKWYEQDVDYPDDAIITPDNVFVLIARPENEDEQFMATAENLINMIYAEDMAFGRKICVDTMSLIYSVVEEFVFKQKNARLADEGVPTYIEALELYHYEDPAKLLKKVLKMVNSEQNKKSSVSHDYIISSFTVMPRNFFVDRLKISEEKIENIQIELSALLTSSVVVNNAQDKDSKQIREIIQRSKSYFNLGLEFIAENSDYKLETVLNYVPLRMVFRLGFSLLIDLKKNANNTNIAIKALLKPDLITLQEEDFINNLLQPIPMFKTSLTEQAEMFETIERLKTARRMLADIAGRILKHGN
jgi:hypothetical protein